MYLFSLCLPSLLLLYPPSLSSHSLLLISHCTTPDYQTLSRNGYYDNVIFHRVIKGFMIQVRHCLEEQNIPRFLKEENIPFSHDGIFYLSLYTFHAYHITKTADMNLIYLPLCTVKYYLPTVMHGKI